MVLMEYCSGGSLETYLQKNRDSFKNLVNKGRLDIDNESRKTLGYKMRLFKINYITIQSRQSSVIECIF